MILLFCLLRVKIAPGAVVCLECELKGDINIGKVLRLWLTYCMLVLYIVLLSLFGHSMSNRVFIIGGAVG